MGLQVGSEGNRQSCGVQLRVGLCSLWVPVQSLSVPAGSLSQLPGFTLTVPQSVSVQVGLCVLVPCTFTYPASYDTDNPRAQLYRYWYKDPADVGQNTPVASSDSNRGVSQETQGRFRLAENPAHGDCSLQISDAQQTDAGRYFLRVEKGKLKYSYRSSADGTDFTLTISVVPGMLLAGEPVTVTCTAPGRCSGTPPRVTWTGPFSDTARDVSVQLANSTWAHSSMLSFTPSPGDHGQELDCSVIYGPAQGPSTSRTIRLHVGYSVPRDLSPPCSRATPVKWPVTLGDVVSLEIQEGDSLNLSCEASSRPEATLSWAKGNESLSSRQGGDGHLELPNLSRGDAGEYRCWAKNSYGLASRALNVDMQSPIQPLGRDWLAQGASGSVLFLFPDPDTLVGNGSQLTAQEGDSLRFLCSVASNPPAALGWVRRAVEGTHPVGENQLRLELPNVTAEDGGLYGCWAQNKESSAQGTFQLLWGKPVGLSATGYYFPATGFLSLTIVAVSPALSRQPSARDWAELVLPAPEAQRQLQLLPALPPPTSAPVAGGRGAPGWERLTGGPAGQLVGPGGRGRQYPELNGERGWRPPDLLPRLQPLRVPYFTAEPTRNR
uniref:Ig-like domain-containing protein n=1 Tax=Terrapene triunguis TaxID=2587831 RepID=A0A674JK16_9SAUR